MNSQASRPATRGADHPNDLELSKQHPNQNWSVITPLVSDITDMNNNNRSPTNSNNKHSPIHMNSIIDSN